MGWVPEVAGHSYYPMAGLHTVRVHGVRSENETGL